MQMRGQLTVLALGLLFAVNSGASSFEDYQTPEGFVTGSFHPAEPSGNSLLFTSEKYAWLALHGLKTWKDINDFNRLMGFCQLVPGLYQRTPSGHPFSQDEEAQDDYIGITAASYLLNTGQATEILTYANTHGWDFAILGHSSWETWLGRSPAFRAHIAWAAHTNPSYFQRWAWAVAIATAGLSNPDAQDPWILSWLMIKTMDHRSWLGDAAALIWEWRLKSHWGSIEKVFARYFGNADHPLAQEMPPNPGCPEGFEVTDRTPEYSLVCEKKERLQEALVELERRRKLAAEKLHP